MSRHTATWMAWSLWGLIVALLALSLLPLAFDRSYRPKHPESRWTSAICRVVRRLVDVSGDCQSLTSLVVELRDYIPSAHTPALRDPKRRAQDPHLSSPECVEGVFSGLRVSGFSEVLTKVRPRSMMPLLRGQQGWRVPRRVGT
jgi:hypothetical protein